MSARFSVVDGKSVRMEGKLTDSLEETFRDLEKLLEKEKLRIGATGRATSYNNGAVVIVPKEIIKEIKDIPVDYWVLKQKNSIKYCVPLDIKTNDKEVRSYGSLKRVPVVLSSVGHIDHKNVGLFVTIKNPEIIDEEIVIKRIESIKRDALRIYI